MSTDVVPMSALLFRARRDLEHEQAIRAQAEDRAREAEETTRRAEERADNLESERDGWAGLVYKLLTPRLLHFDPDLSELRICRIGDHAYDLHSQGFDVNDDELLAGLVNDHTEGLR